MAHTKTVELSSLIKIGQLVREAGLNNAGPENRELLVAAYNAIEAKAAQELESLRLAMRDMPPGRATEMAILLGKAGA